MSEYRINDPPSDGITTVHFMGHKAGSGPHANHLLVSSWDKTVRVYDAQENTTVWKRVCHAPVLDTCFSTLDTSICFHGGLDRTVFMSRYDDTAAAATEAEATVLGHHDDAVKCLSFSHEKNLVLSGSWDKSVRAWDPRVSNGAAVATVQDLPGKVYTMDLSPTDGTTLVVGMQNLQVHIFDLRKLPDSGQLRLLQRRQSSLDYQTRCIRCFITGDGYATGSTEARVAMDFFDPSEEVQRHKYAFKCHRVKNVEKRLETLYPVNAISFHPRLGTFATGGCDGLVNIWDGSAKKRLMQLRKFPTSIASLSFNHDGTLLAIASSYTFEQGELANPPKDEIFIRHIQDAEVMPKGGPVQQLTA